MKAGWVFGVVFAPLLSVQGIAATVTYDTQTGNFNELRTERNTAPPYAGTYNEGTELANYANGGSLNNTPGAAAFQTFTTTGNGSTGTARPLQVGDTFTVTAYVNANPSVGGRIGISFRDSTTYTDFASSTDADTKARFQLDNTGGWKVYGSTSVDSNQSAGSDRTFVIKVTSSTTFDAQVAGSWYYNNTMAAGGGSIESFAIYTFGDSNPNSFWKSASLTDTGSVEVGYGLASGTYTPGLISDGLAANSTVTASPNAVFIGGDAGSQVNLAQNNTYTGATTVNASATGEAQHANALGSTAAGTTVSSGGALKLYDGSGISFAAEPLTLNGTGVNAANGALRSVGGNNTWTGGITLGSNSRINADASGGAGSLTVSGGISGGSNVLYLGANGADISISGQISGAGNTQDDTITSVFKDGGSTLTLSGSNTYTGDTRVTAGTLAVASGGNLGSGSDVYVSGTGTLDLTASPTVGTFTISGGSLTGAGTLTAATYNISGGTVAANLGAGTYNISGTPTITGSTAATGMTVASGSVLDLATSGDFSTVISGAGGVSKTGSTSLTLSGNNSYAGSTDIDAGTLLFNGTNTGNGTVTVATAAAIGGTGSIAGSLTMAAGSKFSFNQAGGLSVGGTVSFTDPANFGVDDIIGLSSATPDGLYTLFGGTVTTAGLANLGSGNAHDLGSGKSAYFVQGSLQVQVVPEPGSFMIIGAGLALASLRRLTSKRRAA